MTVLLWSDGLAAGSVPGVDLLESVCYQGKHDALLGMLVLSRLEGDEFHGQCSDVETSCG